MNTFITPSWVTKDVAMNWKNHIRLVRQFDRTYEDEWSNKPGGAKIGYTVQVRIAQRWLPSEGQALVKQPILNQTVPVSITHQLQRGMGWSSADSALVVEDVQKRYTKPAGMSLANQADVLAGTEVYKSVYYSIGTPGVPITSDETYTDAVAKMRNVGVPEEFIAVLDPKAQSKLLAANFALFNPQNQISQYFKTGQFSGPALGVDEWNWDPNMPTHTTGTFTTSTPVTTSAGQTGSTLTISGMGTYALKRGDVFRIAGVNGINPISYVDTGDLQDFVLTADVAGSSTATLTFSPPIIPYDAVSPSPLSTVVTTPANGAAISFMGATGTVAATMATQTSRQSLLFNPAAFAMVTADLPANLAGANAKRISDAEANISMRWAEQWSIETDQDSSRIDMLVGFAPVLPYFALRAWS